jgi:5-methylthioadenosine/S-adenosylhomocysteine deaminase
MKRLYTAEWLLPVSSAPIRNGAVVVEQDKILSVGERESVKAEHPDASLEDFGRAAIVPGLVNCHSHLELTVMRGYLEDVEHDFFSWLRKLTIARMTLLSAEDLVTSALWGAIEATSNGITCLGDASSVAANSASALRELGLRGIVYQEVFGPDANIADQSFNDLRDKIRSLRHEETALVRAGVSPHSPYTVSAPLLSRVAFYAREEGLPLTIHAAESMAEEKFLIEGTGPFADGLFQRSIEFRPPGISTIRYLESVGILETRPLLAHCIRVDDEEVELIRKYEAGVAHCPKSNAKLGHGYAPLAQFLSAGIRCGFGSDSVASNNRCDIIEESRFGLLFSRAASGSTNLSADQMIEAATLGGARAMALEKEIGSLEPGKQADIAVFSIEGVRQRPVYDPASSLIFSASGQDALFTMVAGREIYRHGEIKTLDLDPISRRISEIETTLVG